MIIQKTRMIEETFVDKIQCDVCKKEYSYNDDFLECQEFLHINIRGGYGSIFGDNLSIKGDICQHCLEKLLGKFLKVSDIYDYENEDDYVYK